MRCFSSSCNTVVPFFLIYNILMYCLFIMYFRYWDREANLCDSLLGSLKQLDVSKMAHLSMDAPSTIQTVLNLLQRNQEKNEYPKLVNIGSCRLHILCGTLKAGKMLQVGMNSSQILKSMRKSLDDSPAHRETCLRSCDLILFPMMFCSTR